MLTRRHLKHRKNPEALNAFKGVLKGAAPVAASFGVSRIGSGLIARQITSRVSNPFVAKAAPIGVSLLFVGLAYMVSKVRYLRKHQKSIVIGAGANVLLTLIASVFPQSKVLLGLAGLDYNHISNQKAAKAIAKARVTQEENNVEEEEDEDDFPILSLGPKNDVTVEDDDLNQGIFSTNWAN